MSFTLTKGQEISITKEYPALEKIFVGLGWDVGSDDEVPFDLDASAFLLGSDGKVTQASDCIFYRNLRHPSSSVVHTGDNTTGIGEGDVEAILVDLTAVPKDIKSIVFTVSIYEADERRQTFGQVKNAYIRIYDQVEFREVFRYDLGEEFSTETSVIFGELVRDGDDWKFEADGQGFQGGLISLCARYGVFSK